MCKIVLNKEKDVKDVRPSRAKRKISGRAKISTKGRTGFRAKFPHLYKLSLPEKSRPAAERGALAGRKKRFAGWGCGLNPKKPRYRLFYRTITHYPLLGSGKRVRIL